jgi:predicted ATP-grasp superfamily ATP-dependent carboligase
MKLRATIRAIGTMGKYAGDFLRVECKAAEAGAAAGTSMSDVTLEVRDTAANRRALYVGRELDIVVTPRGGRS